MIDDIPDIETILDAEGIEEFIVVGWSGGGPRALACAAMLPEQCRAAATLASLAPFDADGLDWMAGMRPGTSRTSVRPSRGLKHTAHSRRRTSCP